MRRALAGLLPLLPFVTIHAQQGLRIVQVPEQVRLPSPGANLLLEVDAGATPEAIWLAVDRAAQDRVPLVAVGNGRYQLNLGAPAVADLLPSGRDTGELFVFARNGKQHLQSPAIAWSRSMPAARQLRCLVRTTDAVTRRAAPDSTTWIEVEKLERLEVQGIAERQSTAVARLAELDVPLMRQAPTGTWTLDLTPQLRERLAVSERFEIELRVGAATESFRFRCVPAKLDLSAVDDEFVVQQRKRAMVPGSRGWLEVRIDDITAGHVLFELVDARGAVVVPSQFVHDRDRIPFALSGEPYVIIVQRLVNALIGDDHAEFVVRPAANLEPDRIAQLLAAIRQSPATFVREGIDHTGPEAARFLTQKLAAERAPNPTVDDFIDRIASQSSRTATPYQIRHPNGQTTPMRDWLRAELKRQTTPR